MLCCEYGEYEFMWTSTGCEDSKVKNSSCVGIRMEVTLMYIKIVSFIAALKYNN